MRQVSSVSETRSGPMLVMCASHASKRLLELVEAHPGRIGWLLSPEDWKNPRPGIPYALDNGAFGCFKNGTPFDEIAFYKHVERGAANALWTVVPDVVGQRDATLRSWDIHAPKLLPLPLAFAVQDGMTETDVPQEASVVFVGGTTRWKWTTARYWCSNFPRVHIARVNTRRQLLFAAMFGAQSTDGTGWFRGDDNRLSGLERFLRSPKGA